MRIVNFVDDIFIRLARTYCILYDHFIFLLSERIFLPHLMSFKKLFQYRSSQNVKTVFIIILKQYLVFPCANTGTDDAEAVLWKTVAASARIKALAPTLLVAIVLFTTMYSQKR